MLTDKAEAAAYLSEHYWDDFTDTTQLYRCDSVTVNGVKASEIEQEYANFLAIVEMAGPETAVKAVSALFRRISAVEQKDTASNVFETLSDLTRLYLYDANSPYRNEDYYLPFVEGLSKSEFTPDDRKPGYEYDAKMCALNQVGTKAADFRFRDENGRNHTLYGIDADYVIPMDTYDFNTMDFSDLAAIIELGRTYVDANQEVFDSLEKDLEKKQSEVPLNYYDRPEFMIVKIIYPGLEKYDKYFDYFEGKAATKELMQEFERTLRYLKLHERLKSVSFQMYPSGYIYVEVENYKKLSSSLSMGLDVSMGGRYHNSGSRRLSFFFMPLFGINNAAISVIAYNYGARKPKRITHTLKITCGGALALMVTGLLVFQFAPDLLLALFNPGDTFLAIGRSALRIISWSFPIAAVCIALSASFQALGNGSYSTIISLCRQMLVLLPVAYLLSLTGEVNNVWLAYPIAEVVSGAATLFFFRRIFRKKILPLFQEQ